MACARLNVRRKGTFGLSSTSSITPVYNGCELKKIPLPARMTVLRSEPIDHARPMRGPKLGQYELYTELGGRNGPEPTASGLSSRVNRRPSRSLGTVQ